MFSNGYVAILAHLNNANMS